MLATRGPSATELRSRGPSTAFAVSSDGTGIFEGVVPPRHRRRRRPTFPCPNCSAEVPEGASFCRECGSDESTGWSEATLYDDLDLPEAGEPSSVPDTFEEFLRLTGERAPSRRRAIGLVLLALAILLLVL